MKKFFLSVMLTTTLGAYAQTYTQTFTENTPIPDGNPVGISFTEAFNQAAQPGDVVSDVELTLNVTGGYNGDLYAYLVAPNGSFVLLFNQPGVNYYNPFGYGGSGFNVTLSDADGTAFQFAPETTGAVVTGTYQAYDALANFIGSPANGDWTLYFEDCASGGGTSELVNWSLSITTVPEPSSWLMLAISLLGIFGLRSYRISDLRKS